MDVKEPHLLEIVGYTTEPIVVKLYQQQVALWSFAGSAVTVSYDGWDYNWWWW